MFRAIVKACQLCIWNYLGVVIWSFFFWVLVILNGILTFSSGFNPAFLFAVLLPLFASALWFAGLLLVWSLLLKLLWEKPPHWLNTQWSNFGSDFLISMLSALPIVLIFVYKAGENAALEIFWEEDFRVSDMASDLVLNLWWLWLLTAVILCGVRELKQTN